jgi:hypothetical protein
MIGNLACRSELTNNNAVQQTDLRTRRTSPRLPFADHINGFIAGDRMPSSQKRAEVLTRVDPALDRPMIPFQKRDIARADGCSFPPAQLRI